MPIDKKLLYVGPSWAVRSFDTPGGDEEEYTNLYRELDLDVIDLSRCGAGNLEMLGVIQSQSIDYDGVIWVLAEPLLDRTWNNDSLVDLIESDDFWDIRTNIYQQTISRIAQEISRPIAMIGAHSDVHDLDHPNISVIHSSWQKFLAAMVDVDLEIGWGADVLHRMIMVECPQARPSIEVIDAISNQFKFWKQMELQKVFNWVHPTRLGNQLFANEIRLRLEQWINGL